MKINFIFLISFLLTSTITFNDSPYFITIYFNKIFISNNITLVRLRFEDQLSDAFYGDCRLNELLDDNNELMLKTRRSNGITYKFSPTFEEDFFEAHKNFLHELNVQQTPPLPTSNIAKKKKHQFCVIL